MLMTSKASLVRTIAPATEPLTLAETKLYLRVDGNEEDTLISELIVAARSMAEQYLRLSLITQQWKMLFDDYAPEEVVLAYPPVVTIESVSSIARDGEVILTNPDNYFLNSAHDALLFDTMVYGHSVEIIYNTGYGGAEDVPTPIKYGMLAHVAALYDQRGDAQSAALPRQAIALYAPFKRVAI